jgi:hypothetical protein
MINLIEGKINIGGKIIPPTSNIEELKRIANEGLIEERGRNSTDKYYYAEAVEPALRFGVFISLRDQRIE